MFWSAGKTFLRCRLEATNKACKIGVALCTITTHSVFVGISYVVEFANRLQSDESMKLSPFCQDFGFQGKDCCVAGAFPGITECVGTFLIATTSVDV